MKYRISIVVAITSIVLSVVVSLPQAMAQNASPPVLQLNGPGQPNYSAVFNEDSAPVSIVGPNLTLTDADSPNLASATITLENAPDGTDESLAADTQGTGIVSNYNQTSGVLSLSNIDTIANYQQVLSTITYQNLSNAPDETDRSVSFVVNDGQLDSEPVNSTIIINAVNDAPILNVTTGMQLTEIAEDNINSAGNQIATILGSAGSAEPITDPDGDDEPQGMAIYSASSTNGTWQFSTDGSTWALLNDVSATSARLLNPSARVRFVPNPNFNGQVSFNFRAWDQSSGINGATADVTNSGGTSAFSLETGLVTLIVNPVNDPPELDLNGPEAPGTAFSTGYIAGAGAVPITSANATILDVDSTMLISMTVRLQTLPDGGNQEILAAGTVPSITVQTYDPVTGELRLDGNASLTAYQAALRTITYNNLSANPSSGPRVAEFVASDGQATNGTSRIYTSTITISLDNNAPVLDPTAVLTLTNVAEDTLEPAGETIADILNRAVPFPISDIDSGAQSGLAIVGQDNLNGAWQYSLDGGSSWEPFGVISDTAAVLLDTSAFLRFIPAPDFFGDGGQLTVRAWDQTSGSSGESGVDVSVNGGTTAYSSDVNGISVTVDPVNDAPQLALPDPPTAVFVEGGNPVTVTGPSLTLTDSDNATMASATVRIVNHMEGEPDVLAATTANSELSISYSNGILQLSGDVSTAVYEAALRSVTFANRSRDPNPDDRSLEITVSDGISSSNVVVIPVRIQSVDDPPELDLNGVGLPGSNVKVGWTRAGSPIPVAPNLDIIDVDSTTLSGAAISLAARPDGNGNERLSIQAEGTNISASPYDSPSGQIILTGVDSLSNYEKVLRTLSYNNGVAEPSRSNRYVQIALDAGPEVEVQQTSTVVINPQMLMPLMTSNYSQHTLGEPNDECILAFPIELNTTAVFTAEDQNDWYQFTLFDTSNVTVELSDFAPVEGQLLVIEGSCDQPKLLGQNGDFARTKTVSVGPLQAGTYYIWVINDGPKNTGVPYKLRVDTN